MLAELDASAPPSPSPLLDAGAARRAGDVLATFYAALRDLQGGSRKRHVRVMWLGDSHGAADFWSGSLRAALQKRFGNGGPGFVHVGIREYRHDGLKVTFNGKGRWKTRPKNPATRSATGDGVFGLGGIMLLGAPDLPMPSIALTDADIPKRLTWDLCYRTTSPNDEIHVEATGSPELVVKATPPPADTPKPSGSAAAPPRPLSHATVTTVTTEAPATWTLKITKGNPEICGIVVEADPQTNPGVVLDTLGVNGARFATPLAWSEASWASELERRKPDLVVLEYGTNEMSDPIIKPSMFTEQIRSIMTRIRKVRPDVDCVALAPTDRADTEDRAPIVRDAIREGAMESGCAFWDTYSIMGGAGSIRTWRSEDPPRAAKDGIHLSWRGYRELGTKLAEDVLRGYSP